MQQKFGCFAFPPSFSCLADVFFVEDAGEVARRSNAMLQEALLDVVGRPLVDAVQVVEFVADAALKFRAEKAIKV